MNTAKAHMEKAARRLRVAEKLLQEDEYEDAISRAYYAMYHAAKAALATINVSPKTHEGLISEFGKRLILTGALPKDLGKILAETKAARETYEYSITAITEREEAETTIEDAKRFVDAIHKFLEERKPKPKSGASGQT